MTYSSCLVLQSLCFQHHGSSISSCWYCKRTDLTILHVICSKIKKQACMRTQGQLSLYFFLLLVKQIVKNLGLDHVIILCAKITWTSKWISSAQRGTVRSGIQQMFNISSVSFFTMLHCQSKWSRVVYIEEKKNSISIFPI